MENYFNVLTEPVVLKRILNWCGEVEAIKRSDVQPVRGVIFVVRYA